MKILIIDEREGNMLRDPGIKDDADIIGVIDPDDTVRVAHCSYLPANEVTIEYVKAVHRDVISAEQSKASWERQQREKHGGDEDRSTEALAKAKRALGAE